MGVTNVSSGFVAGDRFVEHDGVGVITVAVTIDPEDNIEVSFSGLHFRGPSYLSDVDHETYADVLSKALRDTVEEVNRKIETEDIRRAELRYARLQPSRLDDGTILTRPDFSERHSV